MIPKSQLMRALQELRPGSNQFTQEETNRVLQSLIEKRLWLEAAAKFGLKVNSSEVEQELNAQKNDKDSPDAEYQWRETAARLLEIKAKLAAPDGPSGGPRSRETAPPSGEQFAAYNRAVNRLYAQTGNLQRTGATDFLVRLSQIFIGFERYSETEAAQLAAMAIRALNSGEPFAKVAEGTSGEKGDPVFYRKADIDPKIWEVIRYLEIGEVSEPVRRKEGLVIYKLIDRLPPKEMTPQALAQRFDSLAAYAALLRKQFHAAEMQPCLKQLAVP